jgi:hypothetical protein
MHKSDSNYRDLGGNLSFLRRNVTTECVAGFAYPFSASLKSANQLIHP